jgi:hypothetical protein
LKLETDAFCDLSERHGFAVKDYEALARAREGRPAAVLGAIISFTVDPLQGQPGWTRTHVAQETLGPRLAVLPNEPPWADDYTPAAVILVVWVSLIIAALLHKLIGLIFDSQITSVLRVIHWATLSDDE